MPPPSKPPQKKKAGDAVMLARYLGLAFLLPMMAFAGWLAGDYLDRTLHTTRWTTICLVIGIALGFVQLIRELLRDAK